MKTTYPDGYDRRKRTVTMHNVRFLTVDEIKRLEHGSHVSFLANDGTIRNAKINGAPKVWKTRPNEVEIPLKHGMYEYARLDTAEALRRLCAIVSSADVTRA